MVTTKALYSRGGSRMVTLKQHWDSFISSSLIRLLLVPLTKEKQSSVPYLLGSPSNYHWMLVSNFRYAISPPCSWSVSCCFLNIILYALCPVWYWIASRENFYLLSLYIVSYLVFYSLVSDSIPSGHSSNFPHASRFSSDQFLLAFGSRGWQ